MFQVQLSAQDTLQIEIMNCDSILETWTNDDIAAMNQFILERPELFQGSMNICDQAFIYQNYLDLQIVCDSLIASPGFSDFLTECSTFLEMDTTLAVELGMAPNLCDSISLCYREFLLDSLGQNACDSLLLRDDFEAFDASCDSLFLVDSLAIMRVVGTCKPEKVDSLAALLGPCDSLLYCESQEQLGLIADSLLHIITGADSISFRNDCDSLIFKQLGDEAWTFTEAERIILCNLILNDLATTPAEIAEACGITERQLFYLFGRYSKCLRQFGVLSPSILDFNQGSLSIMGQFQENGQGSRFTDLGLKFQPNKNYPSLTLGVTRVFNAIRSEKIEEGQFFENGFTTSAPLGDEVNETGLMLILNQDFPVSQFANVGYEFRANFMDPDATVNNNGYAMLTANLDIDAILSNSFDIDLCGISIELGGFFEFAQIDQNGQFRGSKLLPKSMVSGSTGWQYNEYGVALNVGYKF